MNNRNKIASKKEKKLLHVFLEYMVKNGYLKKVSKDFYTFTKKGLKEFEEEFKKEIEEQKKTNYIG